MIQLLPASADPGLVGNLLVERLIGAHIWQVWLLERFASVLPVLLDPKHA
jgi:hypothetical protein